ncbi:hypothetical protein H5410_013288 [Solanum commersonii]|uniref:Uncharacterized protein n=1 Tax=Solanum commersonii TaxID=4109 RepID=A0A9J6AU52_SOLCO|nr:hypothetical protein H5410_013288 [Solanum commersonii]
MSIYYQALYTVTNSNYGKIYKIKEIIEIDKECAKIVEAEIQQAQISEEYEIQFEKTQEIGSSSSNPRLSLEYGRNSIRKSISQRYNKNTLELSKVSNIASIIGRIYNETEWKDQEILIQTDATANHVKNILLEGLPIYEGIPYTYKTFEGNNYSCQKMVDLPIKLDIIRITVPCYITNHESDHNLILGNLFLNSLEDYNSINDKSQKLFNIRDDLMSLSEQARKMQYEINQLSNSQAENMNEFLLLCEHLDTCPKRNSILRGILIPKK